MKVALAQAFVLPASPPTSNQVTMAQNPALTQLSTALNAAPVSSASQAGLLKPRGAAGARADEKEVTAVYCRPFCETPLPAGDCRKKLSGDRPKDSPNLETITRAGAISARGNSLHGAILHCSTRRRAASSPEQALSASLSQTTVDLTVAAADPAQSAGQ